MRYVTLCYVTCYVTLCYVTLRYVTCHVTLHYVTCYVTLHYVTSYYVTLRYFKVRIAAVEGSEQVESVLVVEVVESQCVLNLSRPQVLLVKAQLLEHARLNP